MGTFEAYGSAICQEGDVLSIGLNENSIYSEAWWLSDALGLHCFFTENLQFVDYTMDSIKYRETLEENIPPFVR